MLQNKVRTTALVALFILCLALLGIVGWWEYVIHSASGTTVYSSLNKENESYSQAYAAEGNGDYADAIDKYQAALKSTSNTEEQFAIHLRLAGSYIQATRDEDAVTTLQRLAQDTTYTPQMRAYAVYVMGSLYSGPTDDRLMQAIFSVAPYNSFFVTGNPLLSYRHLFEYSTQIAPNAYSDTQIAYWYAARARAAYQNPHTYASSTAEYLATAHSWLSKADTDPSWDNTPFASTPDRLFLMMRRAMTFARLEWAGDMTAPDPEPVFKQLVVQASIYPRTSLEAYSRLQYAYYLYQESGAKRAADIAAVLAPLYADGRNIHNDTSARAFLASSATNMNLGNRDLIVGIAKLDPDFKQYLVSLGWQEKDFTVSK